GTHTDQIARGKAILDAEIASFDPAKLGKSLAQGSSLGLRSRVVFSPEDKPADPPHPLALLRARRHAAAEVPRSVRTERRCMAWHVIRSPRRHAQARGPAR